METATHREPKTTSQTSLGEGDLKRQLDQSMELTNELTTDYTLQVDAQQTTTFQQT